ncbi:MAG: hypothetical protein FJ265_16990 [Planctomycetes bacterium]|nr:hypothetical protein [Planctomycetota bacterium]
MSLGRHGALAQLAATAAGGGLYGFAIGAGKNLTYAWRSAVKFPLLLLGTAVLCAVACFVLARFLGAPLRCLDVQRAAFGLFRNVAVMLGSLSPVSLFLGRTMARPDAQSLGGYPAFVGVNMLFLALAGSVALVLQARTLLVAHRVPWRRSAAVVVSWLLLSLLVGGQLAFWLRPFFGIASLTGEPPFLLGDEPTVTGARNFYEVVWQFVTGADPGDYTRGR